MHCAYPSLSKAGGRPPARLWRNSLPRHGLRKRHGPGGGDEFRVRAGSRGRDGWDAYPDASATYGGQWQGPVFVLTHRPEDLKPAGGVTFLNCDVAEAVRIALDAAGGKNLEVLSPSIGRQLLERGIVDEIDLHIAPVLLGDGIRLFDNPGGSPVRLGLVNGSDPSLVVNVRYRPAAAG
ncbi:hypothetical protein GCM10009646_65420 [Streptomyces aureus]